ncbi:CHASE domain-containing protein [Hoeflea sp.]|uniref:CHASE domain-containing sensor histidine kinase n=1 Tax=Hoeflea sp. TaxID=1940281 RepID=UPI00374A2804
MSNSPSEREGKTDSHLSSPLALGIFVLCLLITLMVAWGSERRVSQIAGERFAFKASDIRDAISRRMTEQESILLGGVGLVATSPEVSREQWKEYVATLRQDKYAPGSQGYGYAIFVEPDQKAAVEAKIRQEGYPDFSIKPGGVRDLYSTIVYLEPFDARNQRALGYDMWSNPVRREAMALARDSMAPALSGIVTLVQENGDDVQNGFLMYAPVYKNGEPLDTVADRRAAIVGFVYSPFRAKDLMHGILGDGDSNIDLRIYDAADTNPDALLYTSDGIYTEIQDRSSRPRFLKAPMVAGGRTWTLEFSSTSPLVSDSERSLPYIIGIAGGIIDLLIFLAFWTLSRKRIAAQELASDMTAELRVAKEKAETAREMEIELRQQAQTTNKRLELANDDLTQFASIIAHDLRAPLKRLESFLDIIQDEYVENFDVEGKEILGRMRFGTTRMRDMLDALHRYSTSGGASLKIEPTDISAMVASVLDTLQPEVAEAKVVVDLPKPLYAKCDVVLLQHVFLNLISNALKFSDKDNKEIVISCKHLDDGLVRISIADNGIGIDPEHAQKVFNMFARLHNEEEFAGTGVGLAVCKRIISDLGTNIWVNTNREVGAEILFTLPGTDLASDRSKMDASLGKFGEAQGTTQPPHPNRMVAHAG